MGSGLGLRTKLETISNLSGVLEMPKIYQEACQLFIEQEIDKALKEGKSAYSVGKDIAQWVEKMFGRAVKPHTVQMQMLRKSKSSQCDDETHTDSTTGDDKEIKEKQDKQEEIIREDDGRFKKGTPMLPGPGRPPKFSVTPDQSHFRTSFTGENEWFTPIQYIESAKIVMGDIDLDPATSAFGQKRISAKKCYTVKEDALINEWIGKIWLNPPYSQPLISNFITKLIEQFKSENVKEAIVLTHNYTDTSWFHLAETLCTLICFTKGRIKFEAEDGSIASPTQGSAFFYYGSNGKAFKKEFIKYGFIR